ncbi:class I adenylate-forming enzyme family protein [Streptomyces sp. NPDC001922]|uniref:class I adenylate-forming enzyme family protein n=1 Tax=Streptomyces sp. NPDC001922 TaxID=3364624 RepID=UPI0036BAF9D3
MLSDLISGVLLAHGERTAVVDRDTTLGYRELYERSAATALDLAARGTGSVVRPAAPDRAAPGTGRPPADGEPPNDDRPRAGIRAANSAAYVVAYLAVLRAGWVPFLIDRAAGPQETEAIAEDCGLDLLLHDADTPAVPAGGVRHGSVGPLALTALPARPDRPPLHPTTEVCRFTSGSTGRPHCIEFSAHAVHRAAQNWVSGTGLTSADRIACFASLSNGLAFNTSLLPAFLTGAELHLAAGLPTAGRVVRMLEQSRATRLVGFPALYESLVRRAPDRAAFRDLRMAISSAAPLGPETKERFTTLTGVPVQNYFGAAEAGPLTFAPDPLRDPGLGRPLPGVSLRAGTVGTAAPVEVRSESMGTRYLNAPGALESRTTADGYYRTGDLGYLYDGSLVLTGRTSQVINVGGRKIDAVEVAEVLRGAAGVRDAVVLEVTDRHGGPALGAVLAADPALDPAGPRRHTAERLAAHKVPSLLRVVPEIPRGTTGKPAMAELRRLFDAPGPRTVVEGPGPTPRSAPEAPKETV